MGGHGCLVPKWIMHDKKCCCDECMLGGKFDNKREGVV
jgi:hypothetical protein